MDIGDVTVETFAGREGQAFAVKFSDGQIDLELAALERAPDHWGRTDRRDPFSAIFHGPLSHVLPQGTWMLEHDELGPIEMFLTPVGPEGEAMQYEAVFN